METRSIHAAGRAGNFGTHRVSSSLPRVQPAIQQRYPPSQSQILQGEQHACRRRNVSSVEGENDMGAFGNSKIPQN
jgi:hypothetical protein